MAAAPEQTPQCAMPLGFWRCRWRRSVFLYCLFVCLCPAAKRTLACAAPCHQVIVTLRIWLLCEKHIFHQTYPHSFPGWGLRYAHAPKEPGSRVFQPCGLAPPAPSFLRIQGIIRCPRQLPRIGHGGECCPPQGQSAEHKNHQ